MSHVRQQIRARVGSLLNSLPTLTGRVYASRAYPAENLPCALVYATREESHEVQLNQVLDRELSLVVELVTRPGPTADDELDAMCTVVEAALGDDAALAGYAFAWFLSSTEITFTASAGTVGVARLTYTVFYRTSAADAGTIV